MIENNKNDKFTFANSDINEKEDSFLLEEDNKKEETINKSTILNSNINKKKKRITINGFYLYIFFSIFFCFISVLIGLLWQAKYNLLAFTNAFWIGFALKITISWGILMYNLNILSPLIHGLKTFFLMFVGKKPKEDYYTYITRIKENRVDKKYIITSFITTSFLLLLAIILTIIWYALK